MCTDDRSVTAGKISKENIDKTVMLADSAMYENKSLLKRGCSELCLQSIEK